MIEEYRALKIRYEKNSKNQHILRKLKEIERRYVHETGQKLIL